MSDILLRSPEVVSDTEHTRPSPRTPYGAEQCADD